MSSLLSLFLALAAFAFVECYIVDPGPVVKATKGEVWPKPQVRTVSEDYFVFRPSIFDFKTVGHDCALLQSAYNRYRALIKSTFRMSKYTMEHMKKKWRSNRNFVGYLDTLEVNLTLPCADTDRPTLQSNEEYFMTINSSYSANGVLLSNSVWGIMRGLETFSQLIHTADDGVSVIVNSTGIDDWPRFPHRGLLLDTSRHYLPVSVILKNIDGMAYNKLNVFHWHIVDDHSFPYQSINFPQLSIKGAFEPDLIYNPSDVAQVVEYARERGIRVLSEFDTPGHTRSWGQAHIELLTACYDENGVPTGRYGPLDPTKESTYTFLNQFLQEIIVTFPDQYVHLGGDEVGFECWQSNPEINSFMDSMNMTNDYRALEDYYIQRLINMVDALNMKYIVWEEVFTNNITMPRNQSIVHVWIPDGVEVMTRAAEAGYTLLLSAGYYLDHISGGGDWIKFYNNDPYDFTNSTDLRNLVLGGEACMWGESVNEHNVLPRVWPRASAAAEKFWSAYNADVTTNAAHRLEEHACRMNKRGIPAQPPNGPGFCPT